MRDDKKSIDDAALEGGVLDSGLEFAAYVPLGETRLDRYKDRFDRELGSWGLHEGVKSPETVYKAAYSEAWDDLTARKIEEVNARRAKAFDMMTKFQECYGNSIYTQPDLGMISDMLCNKLRAIETAMIDFQGAETRMG